MDILVIKLQLPKWHSDVVYLRISVLWKEWTAQTSMTSS